MTVELMTALGTVQAAGVAPLTLSYFSNTHSVALPAEQGSNPTSFEALIANGIDAVNTQLQGGEQMLARAAAGDGISLHQVMLKLEESRLGFQLMLQVRNRLLESYQEVMRMQV